LKTEDEGYCEVTMSPILIFFQVKMTVLYTLYIFLFIWLQFVLFTSHQGKYQISMMYLFLEFFIIIYFFSERLRREVVNVDDHETSDHW